MQIKQFHWLTHCSAEQKNRFALVQISHPLYLMNHWNVKVQPTREWEGHIESLHDWLNKVAWCNSISYLLMCSLDLVCHVQVSRLSKQVPIDDCKPIGTHQDPKRAWVMESEYKLHLFQSCTRGQPLMETWLFLSRNWEPALYLEDQCHGIFLLTDVWKMLKGG